MRGVLAFGRVSVDREQVLGKSDQPPEALLDDSVWCGVCMYSYCIEEFNVSSGLEIVWTKIFKFSRIIAGSSEYLKVKKNRKIIFFGGAFWLFLYFVGISTGLE